MCITLTGKLKCQRNQTLLYCKLGKFVLDEKPENLPYGTYDGFFEILQIVPISQRTEIGLTMQICVKLGQIALTTPIDSEQSEQTDTTVQTTLDLSDEPIPDETPEPAEEDDFVSEDDLESEDDAALFGTLWPLSDTVCLDTTLEREALRKQSQRLRELGYSFDKDEQAFKKSA